MKKTLVNNSTQSEVIMERFYFIKVKLLEKLEAMKRLLNVLNKLIKKSSAVLAEIWKC